MTPRTTALVFAAGFRRRRDRVVHEPGNARQPDLAVQPGVPRVLLEKPGVVTVLRLDPRP